MRAGDSIRAVTVSGRLLTGDIEYVPDDWSWVEIRGPWGLRRYPLTAFVWWQSPDDYGFDDE